jgi:fructose-bisphosphate aldolase, class I
MEENLQTMLPYEIRAKPFLLKMRTEEILETANSLLTGDKGILAMDEGNISLNEKFRTIGLPETDDLRRAYREMIVTTPGLGDYLSGAILYEETARQTTKEGISFVDLLKEAGVVSGIKVDCGVVDLAGFPGEKITLGLDSLRERLADYRGLGMRFASWRAVIDIGNDIPSTGCISANMHDLARYAALCQESGLLPIVESEVLMNGDHHIERCFDVTGRVLWELFRQLEEQRVDLHGILLKPNMILPGTGSSQRVTIADVANATVECMLKNVPRIVPGIAFLSGAQSPELSTAHLNMMHLRRRPPWAITFSFSSAIQQPAMEKWKGREENIKPAQQVLYRRIMLNAMARRGEYEPAMENN